MLSRKENRTPYWYSYAWQNRKTVPNRIVRKSCQKNAVVFPLTSCAWPRVMVTPEVRRRSVLTRGRPHMSSGWVSVGGQTLPILTEGTRLTWKKPQKNAKNSITSERIKRSIPIRRPSWTFRVWYPWLDSRTMEVNQVIAVRNRPKKLAWMSSARGRPKRSTPWREKVSGTSRLNRKKPVRKGNGLASRMWKGWRWLKKFFDWLKAVLTEVVLVVEDCIRRKGFYKDIATKGLRY